MKQQQILLCGFVLLCIVEFSLGGLTPLTFPSPNSRNFQSVGTDRVYFSANDGTSGDELWYCEITSCQRASDIRAGQKGSNPTQITLRTATEALFGAEGETVGRELYKVDTTTNTVTLVKNINSNAATFKGSDPQHFVKTLNGFIHFSTVDATTGERKYIQRSDGTDPGTTLRLTMPASANNDAKITGIVGQETSNTVFISYESSGGTEGGIYSWDVTTAAATQIYNGGFVGQMAIHKNKLLTYKSDTSTPTFIHCTAATCISLSAWAANSDRQFMGIFTDASDVAYFVYDDIVHWIDVGIGSPAVAEVGTQAQPTRSHISFIGDTAYWLAHIDTASGTWILYSSVGGANANSRGTGFPTSPDAGYLMLQTMGDSVYFIVTQGSNFNTFIYTFNATEDAGITLLTNIGDRPSGCADQLEPSRSLLGAGIPEFLFWNVWTANGYQIYRVRSDVANAIADIIAGPEISDTAIEIVATVGNKVYFFTSDSENGYDLWVSDGTSSDSSNTFALPTLAGCSPATKATKYVSTTNGKLFWVDGTILRVTDGTTVTNLRDYGSAVQIIASIGNVVLLSNNNQLFKSDGTAVGTPATMYANLQCNPSESALNGNSLYLICGAGSDTLYRIDSPATSAPTNVASIGQMCQNLVATTTGRVVCRIFSTEDIYSYLEGDSTGNELFTFEGITKIYASGQNVFFFTANSIAYSDGTSAGTAYLKSSVGNPLSVATLPSLSSIAWVLTATDTGIYSDGTTAGTYEIYGGGFSTKLVLASGEQSVFVADTGSGYQIYAGGDQILTTSSCFSCDTKEAIDTTSKYLYFRGEDVDTDLFQVRLYSATRPCTSSASCRSLRTVSACNVDCVSQFCEEPQSLLTCSGGQQCDSDALQCFTPCATSTTCRSNTQCDSTCQNGKCVAAQTPLACGTGFGCDENIGQCKTSCISSQNCRSVDDCDSICSGGLCQAGTLVCNNDESCEQSTGVCVAPPVTPPTTPPTAPVPVAVPQFIPVTPPPKAPTPTFNPLPPVAPFASNPAQTPAAILQQQQIATAIPWVVAGFLALVVIGLVLYYKLVYAKTLAQAERQKQENEKLKGGEKSDEDSDKEDKKKQSSAEEESDKEEEKSKDESDDKESSKSEEEGEEGSDDD